MSIDYTQQNTLFLARKAVRYISLFGLSRTLAKVRGQYHMKAAQAFVGPRWTNPACRTPQAPERSIGIIGCGNYAFANIAFYLAKHCRRFLRSTYDRNPSRALSLCRHYGGATAVADWQDMLADPLLKTVFISSNHSSHAEFAVACLQADKNVHIEKPHVVDERQLERLLTAMREHPGCKVLLGFNRPRSPLFCKLRQHLATQSGPLMINWFVAGHEIPDGHWYFDEREGGRVLGNLCHWTDLSLNLVGLENAFPCEIVPASPPGAKSDFVVSMIFADGSCASITFSAKGHTFEGVREVLNVHKGNILGNITDFGVLTMDVVEKKLRVRQRHRDHGHEANIVHSLDVAADATLSGESIGYVAATAELFLGVRRALESGQRVTIPSRTFR